MYVAVFWEVATRSLTKFTDILEVLVAAISWAIALMLKAIKKHH
jgi:hypothetical protein